MQVSVLDEPTLRGACNAGGEQKQKIEQVESDMSIHR